MIKPKVVAVVLALTWMCLAGEPVMARMMKDQGISVFPRKVSKQNNGNHPRMYHQPRRLIKRQVSSNGMFENSIHCDEAFLERVMIYDPYND